MTLRSFCTIMDRNYLTRGLALYDSLKAHCPAYELFVLCMDQPTWAILEALALQGLRLVSFKELAVDRLRQATQDRNVKERSVTCKSVLMRWLFHRHADLALLSYVDSDLFFFADPAPLFDLLAAGSVSLTEHRFPARLEPTTSQDCGFYNGGWVGIRRDEQGLRCLEAWYEQCLAWCYDRIEDEKYGDQKYLDAWPQQFGGVVVLHHKGANLAPWNVENYRIRLRHQQVLVDEIPLIFYHFSSLRQVAPWLYQSGLMLPAQGALRAVVYRPYVRTLRRWEGRIGHYQEPDYGFRTSWRGSVDILRHLWSGRLLLKMPGYFW